jgi:cytochrome c553
MKWAMVLGLGLVLSGGGVAMGAAGAEWGWLWPNLPAVSEDGLDAVTARHVPGSVEGYTDKQVDDLQHAVDWFPGEHPVMPAVVADGFGAAKACGFCHLPSGVGRPENSSLAGLPADYIRRQVAAFADGLRRAANPAAKTTGYMTATAKAVPAADLAMAAEYYSKLAFVSPVRVVEADAVSFRPARFVYEKISGAVQPIGDRIIEVPDDFARFELRDPHVGYTAYVPPGSIAAGRVLAMQGGPAGQACGVCHGAGLRGGIAPPLAGRSPTMIVRQLVAFQAGARANVEAAPMRRVAAGLSMREMVALGAFAGSLKP